MKPVCCFFVTHWFQSIFTQTLNQKCPGHIGASDRSTTATSGYKVSRPNSFVILVDGVQQRFSHGHAVDKLKEKAPIA